MPQPAFKDHFSQGSDRYARFRPGYPPELFAFLAGCCRRHRRAWDCGTGSGQAALGLAEHFERVDASDPSAEQLEQAKDSPAARPNVHWHLGRGEDLPAPEESLDLVTVAQALHWFDRDAFYAQVDRALVPAGVLAIWGYSLLKVDEPAFDAHLQHFHDEVMGPYWQPERLLVDSGYRGLTFPYEPLPVPPLAMRASWSPEHLLGYLGTWSALRKAQKETGREYLPEFREQAERLWGDPRQERPIRWPLFLYVSRKPASA